MFIHVALPIAIFETKKRLSCGYWLNMMLLFSPNPCHILHETTMWSYLHEILDFCHYLSRPDCRVGKVFLLLLGLVIPFVCMTLLLSSKWDTFFFLHAVVVVVLPKKTTVYLFIFCRCCCTSKCIGIYFNNKKVLKTKSAQSVSVLDPKISILKSLKCLCWLPSSKNFQIFKKI